MVPLFSSQAHNDFFAAFDLIPTMSAIVAEVTGMFDDELYFFGGDETACPYAR